MGTPWRIPTAPTGKYYMHGICTAATIAVDATTTITIINYHQ